MKTKAFCKKIIAGDFKGKQIELPSKETTRSSKAIVLESFFNTLQFDIIDATFVELFSGSGSVGLEALSRGAKRVIFMERDTQALKVLERNIGRTDPLRCEIVRGDTFSTIAAVCQRLEQKNESAYFFIDPPFSYREGMEQIYQQMLSLIAALPRYGVKLIAIEHMSSLVLEDNIGVYALQKRKKFGKTTLSYYM